MHLPERTNARIGGHGPTAKDAQDMTEASTDCDVIVIGAGIAGLVAANRAAQLGRRVVVLDKSTEDKYICNSRYAYGTFHINFTDLATPEKELTAKIEAATSGFARKDLAHAVAKDGRRLVQWLRSETIEFVNLGGYGTNVLSPPWREGFGLHWEGFGGDVALQRLEANFQKRQGRILRGTRACALKLVPGGIEVEAEQAGGSARFRAPAVVIADGGFQANLDMLRANGVTSAPEKLLARNGGTAVGDGLRLAQSLGAAVTTAGMNNFYGHLHVLDAMTSTKFWPRPVVDELAAAGVLIDAEGRRFADESLGGIWLANAVARQPDPLGTTIVFDQAIWDGPPGRAHVQPPNPLVVEAGGTLHRAGTLAELAAKIGLAAERLINLVGEYNDAIEGGMLHQLSPPRGTATKPWPIETPPFYAMPICAAITNTMGGMVVNGDGAVLDDNDKPIPGLYAAGSTVGGLDGGPHAGYVGGLIKAVIGLRAAERIAAAI
jgi:fumarate reductase flavoprotein subunit